MGLKRVIPEGMDERDFIDQRAYEAPDFDEKEHARLIGNAGSTPMWMSAREILKTHRLVDESGGLGFLSRSTVLRKKAYESLDTDLRPNIGTGDGSNIADSITKHGYDWTKPIPLAAKGINESTRVSGFQPRDTGPMLTNGQHRLAYMWAFHPDEPIPVDITNYNHIFLPSEQNAITEAHYGHKTPEKAIADLKNRLSGK
jgi:hypothetical protein